MLETGNSKLWRTNRSTALVVAQGSDVTVIVEARATRKQEGALNTRMESK